MGKQLILAEKPSVAREIARVLGARQNENGYIEGPRHIVTWALGHLVTLAEPEAYGDRYRTWSLDSLPMLPDRMELVVIAKTAKQYGVVRSLMARPDVTDLVIATDAGREGELVARWIMEKANFRKPASRLWISSQTDRAISEGFLNLKPAATYDNLFKSAVCRAQADWLVGLNVTRALACKHNARLSAGRVQTPTLSLIVRREEDIRRFVPEEYFRLAATAVRAGAAPARAEDANAVFTLMWQNKKTGGLAVDSAVNSRIFDGAAAQSLVDRLSGKPGRVVSVKRQKKSEPAPLAYDLAELQRDANRLYAYSAKRTLTLLQGLYERHKLVTYPRTDSRHITRDVAATLPERLRAINKGSYAAIAGDILRSGRLARAGDTLPRFVDDARVTDHHAIIPTEQPMAMGALDTDEKRVYDLIVKRFLAVLCPPHEYEETTVAAEIDGERFVTRGRAVAAAGWRSVYAGIGLAGARDSADGTDAGRAVSVSGRLPGEDETADGDDLSDVLADAMALPRLAEGDRLDIRSLRALPAKTRPPARYTEATLLTAMEHPGERLTGIGTPATRADIIEKLFDAFYVERGGGSGKEIIPTSKGRQLVSLVPEDLRSAELTSRWEQQLERIAQAGNGGVSAGAPAKKGRRTGTPAAGAAVSSASDTDFIREIREYTAKLVASVAASSGEFKHDNLTRERCPNCGEFLLSVSTKKGELLVCQDRECGYRRNVGLTTNARCPDCHKKLVLKGDGESRAFYCVCGYRERFAEFLARRDSSAGRGEVERFLAEQRQGTATGSGLNSALADQLKALF